MIKKTSEEIGVKVQQDEKWYEDSLEETIDTVTKQEKSLDRLKSNEVLRLGRILEKTGLVEKIGISAKLKRDLVGCIHRSTVYEVCLGKGWTNEAYNFNPKGNNVPKHISDRKLTALEEEYADSGRIDVEKDEHIDYLIEYMSGFSNKEQADIKVMTPKGHNWRNSLIEKSDAHMLKLSKQLTDTRIISLLADIRTIRELGSALSDKLYQEQEIRKKHKSMMSK